MFIGDVRQIEDLADGETATPEPDMGYELRTANGDRFERGAVEHLVRRGDIIIAKTTAGEEFAIVGRNSHVLVPFSF